MVRFEIDRYPLTPPFLSRLCLQSPDICNLLFEIYFSYLFSSHQHCRLKFEVTLCAYFAFSLFAARLFCPPRPYLPPADPLLLSRLPTSDILLLLMQVFPFFGSYFLFICCYFSIYLFGYSLHYSLFAFFLVAHFITFMLCQPLPLQNLFSFFAICLFS